MRYTQAIILGLDLVSNDLQATLTTRLISSASPSTTCAISSSKYIESYISQDLVKKKRESSDPLKAKLLF
jgi:hypothetical protein